MVAGGGVQQQADRQARAGPRPRRPGDAVADRPAAPLGPEGAEAGRAGRHGGRRQRHVAGAEDPRQPVAAGQHAGLDQGGAARSRGHAEDPAGQRLPARQGRGHRPAGRPGYLTTSASRSTWSGLVTVGSKISSSMPSAANAAARSLTASGERGVLVAIISAKSPRNP